MALELTWVPLVLAGLAAGLLAGLFGVGGGVVVVPAVYAVLVAAGLPAALAVKLALGTSLASIVFTGSVSAWRHQRRGAVEWQVVAALAPGLIIGAGTAGAIAHLAPGEALRTGFALFLLLVAARMLQRYELVRDAARELPPAVALLAVGLVFGVISGLAGVGGGALVVPFLLWSGLTMTMAVGTAAASGIAIAVAGSIGYLLSGWSVPELPEYAIGYIYLPALAAVVLGSMVAVPVGVWAAHRLPPRPLQLAFAAMIVVFAGAMLMH